jgi:hypothetical protein
VWEDTAHCASIHHELLFAVVSSSCKKNHATAESVQFSAVTPFPGIHWHSGLHFLALSPYVV